MAAGIKLVLGGLSSMKLRSGMRNDDGVDQLHNFVTVSVVVIFAGITGVFEYGGKPIDCYIHGNSSWKKKHVNWYCWQRSLYKYPDSTNHSVMPYTLNAQGAAEDPTVFDRTETLDELTFFRWVTTIFALQAICFRLPKMMWNSVNAYSGSNIFRMVEMLQGAMFTKREEKTDKLRQVALFFEQWLRSHRNPHWFRTTKGSPLVKKTLPFCTLFIGDNISNYLSMLYLAIKSLYLLNNDMQFFILSAYLKLDFWTFGTRILTMHSAETTDTATTDPFPLLSLCHFQTYGATPPSSGPIGQRLQCLLKLNVVLEKIFLVECF